MTDRCDCGAKVGDRHLPACHSTGIVTPQGNEGPFAVPRSLLPPGVTPRSNERFNVADMQGNPVPDDVVAGNLPPWHEANKDRWDLRDAQGHLHSPAWYLDAFLVTRDDYNEALQKQAEGEDDEKYIQRLDNLQIEHDIYATYVNRLFGSDMIEGVWNKSK